MAQWSVATFENVYKTRYPKGVTGYLAEKSDFFAWLPLDTGHGGDPWRIVYRTNAVRGSSQFSDAVADRNASSYTKFDLDYAEEHVIVSISMKAARRASKSEHAIVKLVEEATMASVEEMVLALEHKLWGNGGGARGEIAAGGISTDTITLADPSTTYLFYEGMKIQLSDDDGTVSPPAGVRAGVAEIEAVRDGTLILTQNVTDAIAAAVAGDFIFRNGDYDAAAQRIVQGMTAWNPATAPAASPTFFGADRSTSEGLHGTRVNAGGTPVFDALREGAAKNKNNRGKCDTFWCNPLKQAEVDQAMGANQRFTMKTGYAGVELTGVQVSTQQGFIKVLGASCIPEDDGMLTSRDAWELGSVGGCPHEVNDDGQVWHIEEVQDAMQHRLRAYLQLGCVKTQNNTRFDFAA